MHVQSLLLNVLSTFKNKTDAANVELLRVSVIGSLELHSHDRLAIGFPPKTVQVKFTESPVVYTKL